MLGKYSHRLCRLGVSTFVLALSTTPLATPLMAQPGGGPAVVGVTAARSVSLRGTVVVPATVEARVTAVVASRVAGPVVKVAAREGDRVRRGDLLAQVLREDLKQELVAARARLAESTARSQQAEQSLTRQRELNSSGVVSRQLLDNAESEAQVWRSSMAAAEAEIARLQVPLRQSEIKAPFDGVVLRHYCEIGEWLAAGGPVAEVADLSQLEVVGNLPERHFAAAQLGTSARVLVPALPGLEVQGEVVALIPSADPSSRSFPFKVAVNNPNGRIAAGMSASVELAAGDPRQVLMVPKDALLGDGSKRTLYRVVASDVVASDVVASDVVASDDGQTVQLVEVTVGTSSGAWVEVRGIAADDLVVTRGNERLMADMAVSPQPVEYPEP